MADNLIPYIEFLGVPGSGKSYYSHNVAKKLRGDGYNISEPSWELDHTCSKYSRAIRKICMAWIFSVSNPKQTLKLNKIISLCGFKGGKFKRMKRNLLYKAYILTQRNTKALLFDEGLAQMAVSLSVCNDRQANQIYTEIKSILSIQRKCILIRIDCSTDDALHNMEMREKHDSQVERLTDLDSKKKLLNLYKHGCESLSEQTIVFKFNLESNIVVNEIANHIKTEL